MQGIRSVLRGVMAASLAAGFAAPAPATTLVRAGLEDLVAGNATIVVGEVREVRSHWNEGRTEILSEVDVTVHNVLKGDPSHREMTLTILGGTVGDLTSVLVGGPKLRPGSSYVLFLNEGDLPGARGVRTVRWLSQGVFDIELAGDGLRAKSQARHLSLVPDHRGQVEVAGGPEGMPLETMMRSVRELVTRPLGPRREVQ